VVRDEFFTIEISVQTKSQVAKSQKRQMIISLAACDSFGTTEKLLEYDAFTCQHC
jgi:hypothetical protein